MEHITSTMVAEEHPQHGAVIVVVVGVAHGHVHAARPHVARSPLVACLRPRATLLKLWVQFSATVE